jgi:putative membrane protein
MKKFTLKEDIILRDFLALERTKLANERTLFAYIRTSLYLILAGIAFLQLKDFDNIKWLGFISLILSVVLLIIGIWKYYRLNQQLKEFYRKA